MAQLGKFFILYLVSTLVVGLNSACLAKTQKTKKLNHTSHTVVQFSGSKRTVASIGKNSTKKKTFASKNGGSHIAKGKHSKLANNRGRHHHRHHVAKTPRVRYAYPVDFFMLDHPNFDQSPLEAEVTRQVMDSFDNGLADSLPARSLVRAGVASFYPMRGGIFYRREPLKYIVIHSTETGIPLSAKRVVDSWSSSGRRHAGAQYVVDRDGSIVQAVDPDLGTVHVNIFKTLPGINNDNSIGIEMVHTGKQTYSKAQVQAVIKLCSYLQDRYRVKDDCVITHRYAQQGDHTDPVGFDWDQFLIDKAHFRRQALVAKMDKMKNDAQKLWAKEWPLAPTYQQLHPQIIPSAAADTLKHPPAQELNADYSVPKTNNANASETSTQPASSNDNDVTSIIEPEQSQAPQAPTPETSY
jgi:hypothetical protein